MPGVADSSAVRSAHASTTRRTRDGGSAVNAVLWSEVKQTTSHRPKPGLIGTSR